MNLKTLKESYIPLQKKHGLPEFEKLNQDFTIEKIKKETDYPLREIRRIILRRLGNYLGFIETLINPASAPSFIHIYLKNLTSEDKENMEKIYTALNEMNISAFAIELEYSEKAEADMIKMIYKKWQEIKPAFKSIFQNLQKSWSSQTERKEKTYFG